MSHVERVPGRRRRRCRPSARDSPDSRSPRNRPAHRLGGRARAATRGPSMGTGDAWRWHVHAFVLWTSIGCLVVDTGVGGFGPFRPVDRVLRGRVGGRGAGGGRPRRAHTPACRSCRRHGGGRRGAAVPERPSITSIRPTGSTSRPNPTRICTTRAWRWSAILVAGMLYLDEDGPSRSRRRPRDAFARPHARAPERPAPRRRGDPALTGDLLHLPIQVRARPISRRATTRIPSWAARVAGAVLLDHGGSWASSTSPTVRDRRGARISRPLRSVRVDVRPAGGAVTLG